MVIVIPQDGLNRDPELDIMDGKLEADVLRTTPEVTWDSMRFHDVLTPRSRANGCY